MSDIVLRAEHLVKRYGSLVAVNDLSLDVGAGEVFGLLGPNGAGKSTTIHMLCGLLRPDAGRVLLHGRPVHGGSRDDRTRVGLCPQSVVLWERLTCLEQLQFVGQMYGLSGQEACQRGDRLLADLDLSDKRNSQARTLSGGMQRRLNLAMALVHDPEILVLDEPEAGLDPQSRVKVRDYVRSLARRKTVILTTHNMDEADRLADRVAIVDHGQLLMVDTPANLKRQVGEGDVLEIHLDGGAGESGSPLDAESARQQECAARAALSDMGDAAPRVALDAASRTLHVHALDAAGKLPQVVERLRAAGLEPGTLSIRANTLEDVFIQLTGRRLRD